MSINIKDIRPNDILSEISHYIVLDVNNDNIKVKHLQSDKEVSLSSNYVKDLLKTADQYNEEIKVGKEDKKWTAKQIETAIKKRELMKDAVQVGEVRVKGIKNLWNSIHSSQVFTVSFKKQDKNITAKSVQTKKDNIISEFQDLLNRRPTNDEIAIKIQEILDNPIKTVEPGESRILRGYKVQFDSEDGRYDCVDMDITNSSNIRPVNINTIEWLVFDGIKYIVE